MTSLPNGLLRAWRQHAAVDRALLAILDADALRLVTPGGGWTIEQQLAHAAGSTVFWSAWYAPSAVEGMRRFADDGPPDDVFGHDPDEARRYVEAANEAAPRAALAVGDAREPAHGSATSFLVHQMVHAAHHRSQVVLALKVAGRALPDDGRYWGPWKLDLDA